MGENKIGIALSGGGIEGFAHIGALKALEEIGIKPEYVAGTSTGSIISALYSIGYNFDEMEEICKEIYNKISKIEKIKILKAMFNFIKYQQTKVDGLVDGEIVENIINEYANKKGIKLIKDIKNKKLVIATVDTIKLKECIFISDKIMANTDKVDYIQNITIGKAVRASMAFPGIFPSVNFEQYNFIDGGTIDNLPTVPLKDYGANKIIAIDFNIEHYKPTNNLEDTIFRALDVYSYGDVKQAEKLADIVINIYNQNTNIWRTEDINQIVKNGYNHVMNRKNELQKLIDKRK